ncbi:MAG: AAA family ATPase [Thermoguttaceae bacterium]|jgi:ABC-type ATPase involved in cell division
MRVDRLKVKDFTVFGEAEFEFSPGLNVFIGANGTGKSHVLKLLFSVTRSMATTGPIVAENSNWDICELVGLPTLQTLEKTFRPEQRQSPLTSLIRHGSNDAEVTAYGDFGTTTIRFGGSEAHADFPAFTPPATEALAVFIPTSEVLSMYPGFVAAYERRELSFDETFRDLCVDLSANPLRSIRSPVLADLVTKFDEAVGGKTVLRGDKFYVSLSDDWLLEAPMLAEGLRKLASIAHLIRNGSLAEKSVLFWDEPETNMNPKLIPTIARALLALAAAGIQVFVATHDYLLTNELSVVAEYGTPEAMAAKPRFFCLSHAGLHEPVQVEWGDTIADLSTNPILEEFAAHYDREQDLFAHRQSSEE